MKFTKLFPVLVLALAAVACGKDPEPGFSNPEISFNRRPTHIKLGNPARVNVSVDSQGAIPADGVKLVWNDGTDHTEAMSPVTGEEYEGSFTPLSNGKNYTYYVTVTNSTGQTGRSRKVTLEVSDDGPDYGDPEAQLRLNEIGTYDGGKFIEIYNPGDDRVYLGDVSVYKNGEQFYEFTASNSVSAGGYGVLFAKGTTPGSGVQGIGTTEGGLSGTKSLLIELRYEDGATTVDAFANTRNPNVQAAEWDDEVEKEGYNFLRIDNGNGWYATKKSSTPGLSNGSLPTDAVRLRHQYFRSDALPDAPYMRNVRINPGNTVPQGLTAGSNTITAEAYTDMFSVLSSVTVSVNGSSFDMSLSVGNTYTCSPTFSAGAATVEVKAVNNSGSDSHSFDATVLAAGTTFAAQSNVCLNEINTESDWIEIYNTSNEPVSLSGMYFRKNKDKFFTIPVQMVLPGKSFGLLKCKDEGTFKPAAGYLYLGGVSTGLSGKKSLLVDLRDASKTDLDIFSNNITNDRNGPWDSDKVEINLSDLNKPAGRNPDGTGSWYVLQSSTAGSANAPKYSSDAKYRFDNIVPPKSDD